MRNVFLIFFILSIIVLGAGIFLAIYVHKKLSAPVNKILRRLILGTFGALCLILYPIVYSQYRELYENTSLCGIVVVSVLQCFQNSLRTFILDGAWSDLFSIQKDIPMYYTVYGLLLSVFAPFLTFATGLTYFKSVRARIRFRIMKSRRRPLYIMSELNLSTLLLAEDIKNNKNKAANIVFTDVYPAEDEENFELCEQAIKLGCVLLRTDITKLELPGRKSETEYFLLGHDEAENVFQTLCLINKNKNEKKVKIIAQVNRDSNKIAIDSAERKIDSSETETYDALLNRIYSGDILRVRIFDKEEMMAFSEIPKMGLFDLNPTGSVKVISVLLLGNGKRATVLLKMLLWYCQMDGYQLEINVVDTSEKGSYIQEALREDCPSIIQYNDRHIEGDCEYSIRFIRKEDLFGLLEGEYKSDGKEELTDRLRATTAAICADEDDDENLTMSIKIRTRLSRLQPFGYAKVYAVYENDRKAVDNQKAITNIRTYKEQPYEVSLIGGRQQLYTYDKLFNEKNELDALKYHVRWIDVQKESNSKTRSEDAYINNASSKKECLKQYELHDYYRKSSQAKALHKREVDKQDQYRCKHFSPDDKRTWFCDCDGCMRRRAVEHKRWNAYMRIQGYQYGEGHDSIAKTHKDLIPFSELGEDEQYKDS